MKILVLGLDCAAPELLLGDDRLTNFRRLMEAGCYGRIESVVPPITVPAWICMSTGQDPGSLGLYGFRNRSDHGYGGMALCDSRSTRELAIWDQVARRGKRSVVIGVPPGYPPRRLNGVSVSCMLTPDTARNAFTHPPQLKQEIEKLVGRYPVDVKGFRTDDKRWLKDEIYRTSRKQFEVVRYLMRRVDWDYFQFVEIGLDRMQHGFWKYHDPQHALHEPDSPYREVIRDYYRHLDDELGKILEALTEDTAILVVSDHGAQRLEGGFCLNQWLVREKLLVLNRRPERVTPFEKLEVDWDATKAWGQGGYCGRVFLNVKGREPRGTVDRRDYESLRDDIKNRLLSFADDQAPAPATLVFKPEEIYRTVRNVAPDLITYSDGLYRRAIGGVGYPTLRIRENDTGPDGCNHTQFGAFILAASNCPLRGQLDGVRLLDVAPTLLELGGYDVPESMQGSSLVAGKSSASAGDQAAVDASPEDDQIVRERLGGLGYV